MHWNVRELHTKRSARERERERKMGWERENGGREGNGDNGGGKEWDTKLIERV